MSDIAISVEKLAKKYRIGAQRVRAKNLREALHRAALSPFRYLGTRLREATDAETLWAIRDISFEVPRGEVLGIIGRNGAGKSTLLKILSRITDPSEGRAVINGRVNALLEVGTGFHEELTGRENIYLSAALHGMTKVEIDRKLDEIVDFSGIEKFLDTPVKRYSSGMRVRLGFSVAAHLEPEILIVDEVLAVGDQEFQRRCLGRMKDIASQGRTVLFVSHNLAAMQALCSSAVHIHEGRIVNQGRAQQVVAQYMKSSAQLAMGTVDLSQLPRANARHARLTSFRTLNAHGEPSPQISLGEPATFEIGFSCTEPLATPGFGVVFFTPDGRRVLRLQSKEMSGTLPRAIHGGTVRCTIEQVLLTPGSYYLTLALGDEGKEQFDYLDQCVEIEVTPFDVHGTGRLPTQLESAFISRGIWQTDFH